jgi:long-chain acyl-CoA synthetase
MISAALERHFATAADRVVIREMGGRTHLMSELRSDIDRITRQLTNVFGQCDGLVFGIAMRSSYSWVATMFAIARVHGVLLPVPIEFSDDQIGSLLQKATAVFVSDLNTSRRIETILPGKLCLDPVEGATWTSEGVVPAERIEAGICAIIHTSGTTSKPKGVKIRDAAVGVLVQNVMERVPQEPLHYLSVVPMSLLIEQVLGVYIPLLSGGSLTIMPAEMSEYGARSGNAQDYLRLIALANPDFLYLPPKILEEAAALLNSHPVDALFGNNRPHIITGGARIPRSVLESLDRYGVQVYEAYGLSENSSIISLNYPERRRIGSVGTLLNGIEPKFVNGELLVQTPTLCAGYYNSDDTSCELTDGYLHTGDLAEIRDGYLYITGRKKHVIILSTARNISPEWVESVYKESPLIDDIIVLGEARDELAAVVLSAHTEDAVRAEMSRLEPRLADFARVRRLHIVVDIHGFRARYYTVTGRPRRQLIERDLAGSLYS